VIDVTEILVHWHAGRSLNEMSQSLGVDRKTIRKYIAPATAAGIAPGGPARSEGEWQDLVREWFPELSDTRLRQVTWPAIAVHHEYIAGQLKAGVRMSMIHQRLRDEHGLAASVASTVMTTVVTVTDRSALASALRDLKLSGMLDTLDARLAQAGAGELGHLDFLQVLCQDEISRRQSMSLARRIRRARFETEATLEGFGLRRLPETARRPDPRPRRPPLAGLRRVRHPLRPGRGRQEPHRPGPGPPRHPGGSRGPVPQDQPRHLSEDGLVEIVPSWAPSEPAPDNRRPHGSGRPRPRARYLTEAGVMARSWPAREMSPVRAQRGRKRRPHDIDRTRRLCAAASLSTRDRRRGPGQRLHPPRTR
jgi:IstB-like ATP binding protein